MRLGNVFRLGRTEQPVDEDFDRGLSFERRVPDIYRPPARGDMRACWALSRIPSRLFCERSPLVRQSHADTRNTDSELVTSGVRIGYVGARAGPHDSTVALLTSVGCQVVRSEGASAGSVLGAILSFIGPGDELVVFALSDLIGLSALEVLDRLHERGASLYVLDEDFSTRGRGDRYLRAALRAVADLQPKRRSIDLMATEDAILRLRSCGIGPAEIARRLRVSRMTVWRKLKRHEARETLAALSRPAPNVGSASTPRKV